MRHLLLSILFCLLLLCSACTKHKNIYYLPELCIYILVEEHANAVQLLLSDNVESFYLHSSSNIDQIQIEEKKFFPVSYYTFFLPKETKDTLWYKKGVKINSVKIHMEEIPSYQPYMKSYMQKTFPLDKYFSLQVYWDGKHYSIHIQNCAGKVIHQQ